MESTPRRPRHRFSFFGPILFPPVVLSPLFLVFCYLTRFGVISPCLPFFTLPLPLCASRLCGDLTTTTTNSLPRSVRAGQAAASGGQPTTTTAEGAHFREIFAEDFAPGPRRGSLSGSLSDGYGHPSEGTDGSGSESGGGGYYAAASSSNVRGKKAQYLDETIAGIDQPSPFSFDPHGHGRAGSSSSSSHHYSDSGSDRPGSTHSITSSIPHPPGTASSTTSSTGAPPGSATSGTFFNAFDSLSIDDPAVLAQLAASGGTAPDGSPFFAHMNLEHLGAGPAGGVGFPGGDSHADPDATPMPIKEEPSGGVRFAEGSRIQRPLSSLAALQPSSTNGLSWNSYLGLGTPSANVSASMNFLGGWTPGGGNGATTSSNLAGFGYGRSVVVWDRG
ncbi:hypothetical protein FA13DRAFT_336670 [Coprinellus micaceus]|uniref:Uncharacterized protein n=1 Tax=Coprinellus micaceus TaxID=71717 RepID=A0A4Y7TBT7_COPMI|nr:hypothetical protein FA13DRAFT_336670 [Coprinellus micaceus]